MDSVIIKGDSAIEGGGPLQDGVSQLPNRARAYTIASEMG